MLFVGLTRATRWALLSTVEGQLLPEPAPLLSAATPPGWEVQRQADLATVEAAGDPEDEDALADSSTRMFRSW